MDMLRWQLTSRAEFERLLGQRPESLTDLERAARFLYVQRAAFGGKVSGRTFGVSRGLPGRFDVAKLGPLLEAVHDRLSGVVIERLPYPDLIRRYDGADSMFYLDPPYWGCETDYGAGMFGPDDFGHLASTLASIRGRFLLSINDRPEVRTIFSAFAIEEVATSYTIGRVAHLAGSASELLISGV